jgi:hypothetical protein
VGDFANLHLHGSPGRHRVLPIGADNVPALAAGTPCQCGQGQGRRWEAEPDVEEPRGPTAKARSEPARFKKQSVALDVADILIARARPLADNGGIDGLVEPAAERFVHGGPKVREIVRDFHRFMATWVRWGEIYARIPARGR